MEGLAMEILETTLLILTSIYLVVLLTSQFFSKVISFSSLLRILLKRLTTFTSEVVLRSAPKSIFSTLRIFSANRKRDFCVPNKKTLHSVALVSGGKGSNREAEMNILSVATFDSICVMRGNEADLCGSKVQSGHAKAKIIGDVFHYVH
jgi:hypothetical protein